MIVVLCGLVAEASVLKEKLLYNGVFRALLVFVGVVLFVCGWMVLEGVNSAPPRSCVV